MRIQSESVINHPLHEVYEAYRDRLSEVAAYIPDIREIRVEARDLHDQGVKIHNVWIADREVPHFARSIIKPDMLRWDDYADWIDAEKLCRWKLHIRAFSEAVTCEGTNSFHRVDDRSTKVLLEGELQIDLGKIRGVPRMVVARLGPKVERFIVSLITPNLERVSGCLGAFLDDQT
jgi:hypothetical protein